MTREKALEIAHRVIKEGKPYTDSTIHSSSECGPYSLKEYGIRWGQTRLFVTADGNCYLTGGSKSHYETFFFRTVYDSHFYRSLEDGKEIRNLVNRAHGRPEY